MILYHTAAPIYRYLPSNLIRQLAQFFAEAFGLFRVPMHNGILKQRAGHAVLSSVARSAKEEAHARKAVQVD